MDLGSFRGNEEPFLLIVHQTYYYPDLDQTESLCLPYQAEAHGVKFDLTPRHRLNANDNVGKQRIIIENKEIPLHFDGRKTYLRIRTPTTDELGVLESYELTSPSTFIPDCGEDEDNIIHRRKVHQKKYKQYPGGLTMDDWRMRLALAP